MIADTQPALVATFTQGANSIKTGYAYTMTVNLYKVQFNLDEVPGGGGHDARGVAVGLQLHTRLRRELNLAGRAVVHVGQVHEGATTQLGEAPEAP